MAICANIMIIMMNIAGRLEGGSRERWLPGERWVWREMERVGGLRAL